MKTAHALLLSLATLAPSCTPTPSPAPAAPPSPSPSPAPSTAMSYLHGSIALPGGLTLRLLVTRGPDGATLDIPDQNLRAHPLPDFTESDGTLRFTMLPPGAPEKARAVFSATLQPDGTYVGALDQAGMNLPLTLSPSSSAALSARKRPQTPSPPYPYPTHELTIPVDGGVLACTLALPPGPGPHPALAMRTGSGVQDRDETLFEHKPFLLLADAFARAGIATLRCDDRGAGASAASRENDDLALFADDARAMLKTLAEHPEIDRTKIGVLGHSEGGITVATLVAADAPAIPAATGPASPAFGITLAGPVLSGREVLVEQNRDNIRDQGGSPEHVDAIGAAVDALFAAVVAGADQPTLQAAAEGIADATLAFARAATGTTAISREHLVSQQLELAQNPWTRSFLRAYPRDDLARAQVPVLALFGERDWQVKAGAHAKALREALPPGSPVLVEIVPRTNHLFQTTDTGALAEYAELEETMAPAVLARLVSWTRETVGLEKPGDLE